VLTEILKSQRFSIYSIKSLCTDFGEACVCIRRKVRLKFKFDVPSTLTLNFNPKLSALYGHNFRVCKVCLKFKFGVPE
jgi:hypothetical protein